MSYALNPWPRQLGESFNAMDATIIARAMSILTMDGQVGPVLTVERARDVVRWHEASANSDAKKSNILWLFK